MLDSFFFEVFDLPNLLWAISTGVIFGAGPLVWVSLRWPVSVLIPKKVTFFVTVMLSWSAVTLFYVGQITSAHFLDSDPAWQRALARWAVQLVFFLSMAAGHTGVLIMGSRR